MGVLHLPDNIKIHFAGCETQNHYNAIEQLGVRYALYTAYPFVERMVFGKGKSPIMPLKEQKDNPFYKIPNRIITNMEHTIQDSGLFTLMFGSQKGTKDEYLIDKWYDKLVQFTTENAQGATVVEVDCQKLLGVEKAWLLREKLRNDVPNRIINVFHLEDGRKGLDRLIEFSDYIAISVPELRFNEKKDYVYRLASYIKNRKPAIDIHLLGCTDVKILGECKFCTSSDSTSWISAGKFGYIKNHHVSLIKKDAIDKIIDDKKYQIIREYLKESYANAMILMIEYLKNKYEKAVGNQDYY